MFRVLLFLLFFAPSVLARIGEPYADFAQRAGEALDESAAGPGQDRAILHDYDGRQMWVLIREGIIRTEQYFPVEPQDVRKILDPVLGKLHVLPTTIPSVARFASSENTLRAAYKKANKRLNIYDASANAAQSRKLEPQREASSIKRLWSRIRSFQPDPLNAQAILFYTGIVFAGFAALYCFLWISLLVHEAGHFVAGKLIGWRIDEVRLGGGRVIRAVRRRQTTWYWQINPYHGGWVTGGPKEGLPSRLANFCFTAGGPLATGLFLALLIWARTSNVPFLTSRSFESELASSALRILQLFQCIFLCSALYPARYVVHGRHVESDGLSMWNLLFHREPLPVSAEAQRLIRDAVELERRGQKQEPVELARQAVRACAPEELDAYRLCLAEYLMKAGECAESRAIYREQLDRLPRSNPQRAVVQDRFATAALYANARSFYPECESELRNALAVTPGAVGLQDTLAGLLAECGREEEAAPLLHATFRRADDELAIGISAAYLSILAQKKGRARESSKYRKRAIEFLSADHPLLQRLFRTQDDPVAKLVCAC